MKNKYNISTFVTILFLLMVACSPEDIDHPNQTGLPKASDIVTSITVDQETNIVTFNLENIGYIPVWIFSETDMVAKNPFQRKYKSAGTYSIEVKMYNSNGISDGSVIKEFVVENDYVEPFDPVATLCGTTSKNWVMFFSEAAHIACGASGGNGKDYWAAAPNEKAGLGLYDDILTFSTDGTFKFNPGEGGTVYVNAGSTFGAEYNTEGIDYQVPVEVKNSTYEIKEEGDIYYLVFPANTIVSYIPNDAALSNPRYRVISISENRLELVVDNGTIAWHYLFVPEDYDPDVPEAFDEGTVLETYEYSNGIVGNWMWEASTFGHISCGDTGSNGTGWWSAAANEKADLGLYDDILTFGSTGAYTFNPGEGGTVYANAGSGYEATYKVDENDYQVPVQPQSSTYEIVNEGGNYYLVFPANTIVSYIANAVELSNPRYRISKFTENVIEFYSDNGAIAWHYRFKKVE